MWLSTSDYNHHKDGTRSPCYSPTHAEKAVERQNEIAKRVAVEEYLFDVIPRRRLNIYVNTTGRCYEKQTFDVRSYGTSYERLDHKDSAYPDVWIGFDNKSVPMPEPTKFEKIDNIFQCILVLGDDSEEIIQMREDGYIYGNDLCKAVGKRIGWFFMTRLAKELITDIEREYVNLQKQVPGLIEKHKHGLVSWIHPELALELCNLYFNRDVTDQVRRWLNELVVPNFERDFNHRWISKYKYIFNE